MLLPKTLPSTKAKQLAQDGQKLYRLATSPEAKRAYRQAADVLKMDWKIQPGVGTTHGGMASSQPAVASGTPDHCENFPSGPESSSMFQATVMLASEQ